MKLLTAVIAPNQLQLVTSALDGAGFMATTVATAQASGLEGSHNLRYRGVQYRDQRCVRLEVLVRDGDLDEAVALIATPGDQPPDSVIVWASDVQNLASPRPLAR